MLELPADTPEQAVEAYASAVERLRDAVGIPASFQAVGINEQEFIASLPQQAMNAYADQCAPANPRMPRSNVARTTAPASESNATQASACGVRRL